MNLEVFCLSSMCQDSKACAKGVSTLKPEYFTGVNVHYFNLIKTLYSMQKLELHVFSSQAKSFGVTESDAAFVFSYAEDTEEPWEPSFQELKRSGTKRIMTADIQEIDKMRSDPEESVESISAATATKASSWLLGTDRRFFSGKEVDEMDESYGEPILTGIPQLDGMIYKHGGNRRGQMKGVLLRYKHGKTRYECWECAQNLRMGHKVLYITMEGMKSDITGRIKQVLQNEWDDYRENLFVVSGYILVEDLISIITEAVLVHGVEKVVVDYIQLMHTVKGITDENVRTNICVEQLRQLMIDLNIHISALTQAKKANPNAKVPTMADGAKLLPEGYKWVPATSDAYGSEALLKAAQIILIGYRPVMYNQNVIPNPLGNKVLIPHGEQDPITSLYMHTAITRDKPDYLHKWFAFRDSDEGLHFRGLLE